MSGVKSLDVKAIDPFLKTGPSRIMSGPVRMRSVVLDTPYGEFATWLYVGVTGNVNITEWDGTTLTIVGLAAGVWHPIYSVQVNTAGTTATNILWAN
jgi:hypothetical protein